MKTVAEVFAWEYASLIRASLWAKYTVISALRKEIRVISWDKVLHFETVAWYGTKRSRYLSVRRTIMCCFWLIKFAKILTALCAIHVAAGELGYDYCTPWHSYLKVFNIVCGVAGVIVLLAVFASFMK